MTRGQPPAPDKRDPAAAGRPLDLALPLRILVGGAFAVIVALTIAQVIFRFAIDSPLIWSEELARILLVWVTFLGAAVVCWDGRNLNVDVVFQRLPAPVQRAVSAFNALVAVVFLFVLVVWSIPLVQIEHMSETGALELPASIMRLPATIGGALMIAFILLRRFYRVPRERKIARDPLDIDAI